MTDKVWKQEERRIAKAFGTERTPFSGSNSKMTKSDTLHEKYYIEIKHRKQVPFYKVFLETEKKARDEGKIPMVVLHESKRQKRIVMINLEDFIRLVKQ
ncbi:MAG: hypothetical protein JRN26_01020 [Nitrososphaerota archaeon]|jgi:hypothetical protein|nr:hypothetical protein [Nitrososphaerota archaeon]MDG6935461.1 hypothetical protein [Nitrososphaerota archaeon]MDG6944351.1 hypothetical protein [Nitrososphaerota archaeon]